MKEHFFYDCRVNSFFDEGNVSANQTVELGVNGLVT
ncbi:hypothetical protein IGL98_002486 [Enterococcus sp. DIV0840]